MSRLSACTAYSINPTELPPSNNNQDYVDKQNAKAIEGTHTRACTPHADVCRWFAKQSILPPTDTVQDQLKKAQKSLTAAGAENKADVRQFLIVSVGGTCVMCALL